MSLAPTHTHEQDRACAPLYALVRGLRAALRVGTGGAEERLAAGILGAGPTGGRVEWRAGWAGWVGCGVAGRVGCGVAGRVGAGRAGWVRVGPGGVGRVGCGRA